MLKTIFIGLLFTVTSFADYESPTLNVASQNDVEEADTCTLVASLAYNLAISEGATHPTAVAVSNLAYNNCKKSTSIEPAQ